MHHYVTHENMNDSPSRVGFNLPMAVNLLIKNIICLPPKSCIIHFYFIKNAHFVILE